MDWIVFDYIGLDWIGCMVVRFCGRFGIFVSEEHAVHPWLNYLGIIIHYAILLSYKYSLDSG